MSNLKRAEYEFEAMQRMAPRPTKLNRHHTRLMVSAKEERRERLQDARLNLALLGILNSDGSFKF
jgi:hypothetical protein